MNKSFLIAQSAGYLLGECLGGAKVTTSYSHDHNDFIWELSGYPLYGTRGTGKVYIVFPAKTFAVRGGEAKFEPMPQDQVRLCQGSLDKAFAHPHVYNSGHPCWHDGARSGVADFLREVCLRSNGGRTGRRPQRFYPDQACLRSFPPSSYSKGPR